MKDYRFLKIAGVGLVAFTLGFTFSACANKETNVPVSQSQAITEADQPAPEEDPSIVDDPTIAMDKLLMLPEIMAYFENGSSIDNLQDNINVDGVDCYAFGVMDTNGSDNIIKKYAVEKEGESIFRLDTEPNGWIKVN